MDIEGLGPGPSEATPSSTPFPLRMVPCSLQLNKHATKTKLKSFPLINGQLVNRKSRSNKLSTGVTSVPLTKGVLVNKRLSFPTRTRSVRINNGTLIRKELMDDDTTCSCTDEGATDVSGDERRRKRKRKEGKGNRNKRRRIMEKENREAVEDRDTTEEEGGEFEEEEERGDMEEERRREEEERDALVDFVGEEERGEDREEVIKKHGARNTCT